MSIQEKLFPWAVVAILILSGLLFWMWYENGRKGESAALDRNLLLKGNEILKADLKASQDSIKAERILRRFNDSTSSKAQVLAKSEIERLKRKERGFRANPEIITLTDTIFAEYDTALVLADQRRVADSVSFEKEIKILAQSHKNLTEAYDSTFNDLLSTNDKLIQAIQKVDQLTGKNKVLTWAAILEAVGIVILVLLL